MSSAPLDGWLRIRTLDLHTGGEPLRVVVDGFPALFGDTILARRRYAQANCDALRRLLMLEPRGHADMYGALLLPPATPDGDLGVLFLHNAGWSTMCGHGIIALVKGGLDEGLFARPEGRDEIRLDTPAGRVTATPRFGADGRVERVSFLNVPSFVLPPAPTVSLPGLGEVRGELAFGGAFYLYVDAAHAGLELSPARYPEIVDRGRRIKQAFAEQHEIRHPDGDPDLEFLYGVIFIDPARDGRPSRNVCVFADGEVDRSPTGTGVSGRAAIHHARGELAVGESMTIESLVGSRFEVEVAATAEVGGVPAVVPRVTGRAWVTGRHEFLLDPADPLAEGFLLR